MPRTLEALDNKKADITRQDELSAFETTDSQPKGNETMNSLTFNEVNFNPVLQNDNQIWLTSSELSKALGYADNRSVSKIFQRNESEFTAKMTTVVKLTTNGINNSKRQIDTRIFSLRGCHLIAMFARTKVAQDFRKWVLDILDKEVGQATVERITRLTISAEQQKQIRFAIAKRCQQNSVHYQTVYTALYEHFNVPRYTELLVSDFDEAIKFIQSVNLTPQIEDKEFTMLDGKSTNAVMDYLFSLRREITRLGGKIPEFNLSNEIIAQGIITRMIQGNRMMLSFDMESGARIKFIPQDHWVITEDNIANIIGDADGVKKSRLPEIMNALIGRMGFSR